ncbi:phosphoribosylanthranilate isomerase [Tellurirhabdus rosea]|uniref:phosphoribosylanthranilate isomerase n=1 Tax=Tellurirhabdus rosea TaxID=2674997 RepID=UPI00225A2FAE|nr:N-(5'-phosphoribosyl)anthranilate isomerase [Tellurirhabdus rosea]
MALRTVVKISNVTNLSDARYCAGMGVEMLGFSMDETAEQYVSPQKLAEIRGWLAGVQIVGETAETDPQAFEKLLESYQPDAVQVEDSAVVPYAASFDLPVILKLDLGQLTLAQITSILTTKHDGLSFVLLEAKAPINLDDDLRTTLQQLAESYPVLLGTGISVDNVLDVLANLPLRGIALAGGDEARPGYREFGEMMDILEKLEEE